jgi:putative endonuclease
MGNFKNILTGQTGENIAKDYLKNLGYQIINTNWHYSKNSEIDIIALENNTLVFVEVKTRTTTNFGHPFEAINSKKLEKIHSAILAYLNETQVIYKNYRIDAISIIGTKKPKIEHLKKIALIKA